MIKLPKDLYKNIENEYYRWVTSRLGGDKLVNVINSCAQTNTSYAIKSGDRESFLKALIINPFSKSNREKFHFLEDYYSFTQGIVLKDPLGSQKSVIGRILQYNKLIKSQEKNKLLREFVVEGSGLQVCPYCNRQYIDCFRKSTKGYTAIAQLDHFYSKDRFPLYALSLYNFVPSCASCNQSKSINHDDLIYPFVEDVRSANKEHYFKLKFTTLDQLDGSHLPDIDYDFSDSEKVRQADFFHHKNMYQNHRHFAQRLLLAQRLYTPAYINQIKHFFPNLTDEKVREVLFGFDGDLSELINKPLSKLAHDILNLTEKD